MLFFGYTVNFKVAGSFPSFVELFNSHVCESVKTLNVFVNHLL